MLTLPAFADLHVHFREPGQTWKETIRSGSMAAAWGGYTLVCAMPNLDPVPDSPETLAIEQAADITPQSLLEPIMMLTFIPYLKNRRERAIGSIYLPSL